MCSSDLYDSPQFFSATSRPGSSKRGGVFTPTKSECARSLFGGYSDYPNYMANTLVISQLLTDRSKEENPSGKIIPNLVNLSHGYLQNRLRQSQSH